jgi:sugar O-acyltransferase (sialic acid O-acetyltransferase NeuD family)
LVWGASSQASVVTDIFDEGSEYAVHSYLDNTNREHQNNLYYEKPVFRNVSNAESIFNTGINHAIIAIGDIDTRVKLSVILKRIGYSFVNAIHPNAVISEKAELGYGVIIKPGAVIDPLVKIGDHAYIGSCSTIAHHTVINDYTNIVSGVNISGHSNIGSRTHVGTGVSIKDRIKIGNDVLIGAGSVVTKDIPDNTLAKGVPARFRPLKKE